MHACAFVRAPFVSWYPMDTQCLSRKALPMLFFFKLTLLAAPIARAIHGGAAQGWRGGNQVRWPLTGQVLPCHRSWCGSAAPRSMARLRQIKPRSEAAHPPAASTPPPRSSRGHLRHARLPTPRPATPTAQRPRRPRSPSPAAQRPRRPRHERQRVKAVSS